jgi:hypothetical protein
MRGAGRRLGIGNRRNHSRGDFNGHPPVCAAHIDGHESATPSRDHARRHDDVLSSRVPADPFSSLT